PPSKPLCTIRATPVSKDAVFLEGTNGTISCTSSANPPLITYNWSTPSRGQVSGANLSLIDVQHSTDQGQYTLTVTNTMDPTKENNETVGPQVRLPEKYDISEGSALNYSCLSIPGNPSQTTVVWTRLFDNRQWHSRIVNISQVQKSDDGLYTCTTTNKMTPTGLPVQNGNESIVSDFNVTEHIGTLNVTKAENSNVTFTCKVDSNPQASINIRKDGEIKKSIDTSTQLEYTISNLTCYDAGLYTCYGSNKFNNDTPSKKDLRVLVTCTPRRPSARQHDNATLQYTVFAYPIPNPSQFVWKKCPISKNCSNISTLSGKTEVTTIGLSSNLTIFDIDEDDYGMYIISIDNDIGEELVEEMYLQPAGPPELPTEFHVIEESIGETHATLTWIPGFNNGFRQTFHLSFRTVDELANGLNDIVSDKELSENINYTMKQLRPGERRKDELKHHVDEDDELPDVVENSMYVPAGNITRQINNLDADAVYAQPNKNKASSSEDASLYAEVNKLAKKKAAEKKRKKTTYENKAFDLTYGNHETPEKKKNVNKDGLVYADLDFPKAPKGQKPYIHGLDDMTVYAEVDLSQKADRLPDSDDDASDGKNIGMPVNK
ncbi:CNTN4-like protein, partial [Mya arenaria]